MTALNPYAGDGDRDPFWQEGYDKGFNSPDEDFYPPYAEEELAAFEEGVVAGRDDARYSSSDPAREDPLLGGASEPGEPEPDGGLLGEVAHLVVPHVALEKLAGAPGGLLALLWEVVQIPGDVALTPVSEDWQAEKDREGDFYVAVCPEVHMTADAHLASNGWWIGDMRSRYDDALYEARDHGHVDTVVVVCSTVDGVCGPVTEP